MSQDRGEMLLREYLHERGHSEEEIANILQRVRRYDEAISIDSVMESLADSTSDMAMIIKEVLSENDSSLPDDA